MFRDLNSSLLALKNSAEALLISATDPVYYKLTAISSRTDILTAEVSGTPAKAVYSIFVSRLASQDVVVSNQLVSSDTSLWTTTSTKTFTITVGGVSRDVSVSVTSGQTNEQVLAAMAKAINAAGVGARVAVVSQTAGRSRLVITSTAIGL
ncbi:MAG: hypothetical protein HPY52_15230 [Firmicutes bacterium]|nr:hypothetical protein [Bacillota bacterium]